MEQVEIFHEEERVQPTCAQIKATEPTTSTHSAAAKQSSARIIQHPQRVEEVHWSMFFGCCVGHPTVVARRSVFERFAYPSAYPHAEDYALWLHIITSSDFKVL